MKTNNCIRIISLSALGAGDSRKDMPFIVQIFMSMTNLRFDYLDHSRQEEILARSETNWTVVRLPILTEEKGEADVLVQHNDGVKLKRTINRESVARFVLSILDTEKYFKTAIGISSK